jgi:hypothetical protein
MADGDEQARVVNVDPSFANAALNSDAFYHSEEYMTAQIEFVATQDEDCSGTRAEAMETEDEDEESQHAPSVKRLSLEIRDDRSFPKFSPGMLSAVHPLVLHNANPLFTSADSGVRIAAAGFQSTSWPLTSSVEIGNTDAEKQAVEVSTAGFSIENESKNNPGSLAPSQLEFSRSTTSKDLRCWLSFSCAS